MGYVLAIGDRCYSSWSLRAWLAFARFGIPVETVDVRLDHPAFAADLAPFAPARTVPALRIGGDVIWDSLAIGLVLAERHPEAGHWPAQPGARGHAMSLVAEMHAGFGALRAACPMNLRTGFAGYLPDAAVRADLARIEALWTAAPGGGEGWLFGAYSLVDAFFAPVAARIVGYRLPVGPRARDYVAAHLAEPCFRTWRGDALGAGYRRVEADERDLPEVAWPG
jgi:glutathione S-transferase